MDRDFLSLIEANVEFWHGVKPPNEPGRRLAADLAATIADFEAQRDLLQFEDEPSGFAAALHDCREQA